MKRIAKLKVYKRNSEVCCSFRACHIVFTDSSEDMHAEQTSLEAKNQELVDCYREKSKAYANTQKMYQSLKAQVMATQVADAASYEAAHAVHPAARRDRVLDRLPGTRTGSAANFSQAQQAGQGRVHQRNDSQSSGSGQQQRGINLHPSFSNHLRARVNSGRTLNPVCTSDS